MSDYELSQISDLIKKLTPGETAIVNYNLKKPITIRVDFNDPRRRNKVSATTHIIKPEIETALD